MKKIVFVAAVGVCAGMAAAQTIDFEDGFEGMPVTDQYAAQGVVFSSLPAGPASINSFLSFFGSLSLSNATAGGAAGDRTAGVAMDFRTPITEIQLDWNTAGDPGLLFPVRFFSGGTLVRSETLGASAAGGLDWTRDVTYSALPSVDRIEIDTATGGWLYAIDNIDVTQVPAPASLALVGLGGLMVTRRRR